jgi:hypothetical protein
MKLEIKKKELWIIPESELDEAYIEKVLGLSFGGDSVQLIRIDHEDGSLAHLATE